MINDLAIIDSELEVVLDSIRDTLESGWLSMGENYEALIKLHDEVLPSGYTTVPVSSGTDALDLAFRWLAMQGKKSIAIPEMTVPMVHRLADKHFDWVHVTDVSLEDFSMIGEIKSDVACVVTTGGIPSPRIAEYCKRLQEQGVVVVEDASHSHGCVFGDRQSMTLGDIACQSWYATKVLTMGEGGLVVANGDNYGDFIGWASVYMNQGKVEHEKVYRQSGKNYRINELTAALGCSEMLYRLVTFHRRRLWASDYLDAGMPYVLPGVDVEKSSFFKFPVLVENQDEVLQALADAGVPAAGAVHHSRFDNAFWELHPYNQPNARILDEHQVCLPVSRHYNKYRAKMVIDIMKEVAQWKK